MEVIGDYYAELRSQADTNALPITVRTLETIIRLSTAAAKARLSTGAPACHAKAPTAPALLDLTLRIVMITSGKANNWVSVAAAPCNCRQTVEGLCMLLLPSTTRHGGLLGLNVLWTGTMQVAWIILNATVIGQNKNTSYETTRGIMAMYVQSSLHAGVEEKDVEVAKDILDAIMSGHVEGMPGEDADMAAEEEAAQEEAPRGARRC